MKLQTAITLLAAASPASAQYDTSVPGPVCAKFKDINVAGAGEFVDTDGSGVGSTTGDMSVTFSLTGQAAPGSYPNQSFFTQISLDMNAVCINKRDQPVIQDAPVCLYEGELEFCRNFLILRDEPKVERINKRDVVDPQQFFVFDGRRLVERWDAPDAESDAETGSLRRNLQDANPNKGRNGNGNGNGNNKVDAVKITDEIRADNDSFIIDILCGTKRNCYVLWPFPCIDKRSGGFTAHGTGSSNIKITGGTDGLFGAFGQITTPDSGIDITSVAGNGDIAYNFDAGIEICYYRREDSEFF